MAGSIIIDNDIINQLSEMVEWVEQRPNTNQFFLHLIELLGATIAGVKPAAILTFSLCQDKTGNPEWEDSIACLSRHKQLQIRDIVSRKDTRQILFYHLSALEQTLSKTVHVKFLKGLCYPEQYSLEGYIHCLVESLWQ